MSVNGVPAATTDSAELSPTEDAPAEDEPPPSPEAIATPTSCTNGPSTLSSQDYMTLAEADIYVIKRLSSRVNVLPVISRAAP